MHCGAPTGQAVALPGLDHLNGHVRDWDAAVRTLSLTAAALADSMAAATASPRYASTRGAADQGGLAGSATTTTPAPCPQPPLPLPLPAPVAFVSASQLKPGRLFIVANLQGAYYTLVELLSRHKFDFRQDNLMHLGNLVAPPLPTDATETPATTGASAASATATALATDTTAATDQAASARGGGSTGVSRRCRNSAPLLKLIRRHCGALGGSGGGPMGVNECLTLLAAARSNRLRAQEEQERKQREWQALMQLQQQQQQQGRGQLVFGTGAGSALAAAATARGVMGRRSALSLQLATGPSNFAPGTAGSAPVPSGAAAGRSLGIGQHRLRARLPSDRFGGSSFGESDESSSEEDDSSSDDGSGQSGSDSESGEELVAAPLTPCGEDLPSPSASPSHCCPTKPGSASSPAVRMRVVSMVHGSESVCSRPAGSGGDGGGCGYARCYGSGAGGAAAGSRCSNGVGLEDADLAQLLSLPASVVVEPYGILLQHAGPYTGPGHDSVVAIDAAGGGAGAGRYHTLFSHRRAAAAAANCCMAAATAASTGLASGRGDVVRCVVLPPLRKLQRRSPGFVARVAAGQAPSREDLQMEVVEEPLSELDVGPPQAR